MSTLAAIEAVPTDSKDRPTEDVVLLKATVFSNPIDEMEDALERDLKAKIAAREVAYYVNVSQRFGGGNAYVAPEGRN